MSLPLTRSRQRGSAGQFAGKILIIASWSILVLLAGALSLEGLLKLRWEWRQHNQQSTTSEYSKLYRAYYPFTVQHINPFYLFFFPFDVGKRLSINNTVCSIDKDGFRGADFKKAKGRKLAFLLGGSAAFGHFSSSDNTTITGYLNEIQNRYYFVNAGVPSWNSFQELTRLSQQILDFSPALVVVYDGLNDAALMVDYWTKGLDYPAGTPESFDALAALVEDIRSKRRKINKPLYERFFPRVGRVIQKHILKNQPIDDSVYLRSGQGPPDSVMFEAADRYLANLSHMEVLAKTNGARFVSIFQPIGRLHGSAPEDMKANPKTAAYRVFRDRVFSQANTLHEYFDYSTLFDHYPHETVWRMQPGHEDVDDKVIFVDAGHLYDRGNRFVAETMVMDLALQ